MTITNNNDEHDEKIMTRSQKQASVRNKSIKKRHTKTDNAIKNNNRPAPEQMVAFPRIIIPEHLLKSSNNVDDYCHFSRSEEKYLMSIKESEKVDIVARMKKFSQTHKVPIRFRVLYSKLPNKYDILNRITSSCDSGKLETWVQSALNLPIGRLASPPSTLSSDIESFLLDTREKMNRFVYGQNEAKDEILRLLCQWISSGALNSFAIALEGPPGIGKTTFAKNVIANVMNRPFNFISLGGATDAAYLLGHSFTYEGAIPGRISEALRVSKVMNPCFYFDELDKISKTAKGDEISNILVHLTDKEQNSEFSDRYFNGIKMDLSQSLFVFSYNNPRDINPVLLDRINVVKLKSPTIQDKIGIAKEHLVPRALKASAFKSNDIVLEDNILEYIINNYTDEEGVRNLDKCICKLISTIAVLVRAPKALLSTDCDYNMTSKCNQETVSKILGANLEMDTGHLFMYN